MNRLLCDHKTKTEYDNNIYNPQGQHLVMYNPFTLIIKEIRLLNLWSPTRRYWSESCRNGWRREHTYGCDSNVILTNTRTGLALHQHRNTQHYNEACELGAWKWLLIQKVSMESGCIKFIRTCSCWLDEIFEYDNKTV